MSATRTRTRSAVRAYAREVTQTANELANVALRIVDAYGLSGALTEDLPSVLKGLRVWLVTRQVRVLILEVYDLKGRVCRRWDLPINYVKSDRTDEDCAVHFDELEQVLARDRPAEASHYRILCDCPDGWVRVPGWTEGTLADITHLKKTRVSDGVIRSGHITVEADYYSTGTSSGATR